MISLDPNCSYERKIYILRGSYATLFRCHRQKQLLFRLLCRVLLGSESWSEPGRESSCSMLRKCGTFCPTPTPTTSLKIPASKKDRNLP